VHGTVAELEARAAELGDDYLRVVVREPARARLRQDVVAVLPNALEVRIDPEFGAAPRDRREVADRTHGTPQELFGRYLAAENIQDPDVTKLLAQLHDEVTAAGSAG
jgi:exonuclease SbcD